MRRKETGLESNQRVIWWRLSRDEKLRHMRNLSFTQKSQVIYRHLIPQDSKYIKLEKEE